MIRGWFIKYCMSLTHKMLQASIQASDVLLQHYQTHIPVAFFYNSLINETNHIIAEYLNTTFVNDHTGSIWFKCAEHTQQSSANIFTFQEVTGRFAQLRGSGNVIIDKNMGLPFFCWKRAFLCTITAQHEKVTNRWAMLLTSTSF